MPFPHPEKRGTFIPFPPLGFILKVMKDAWFLSQVNTLLTKCKRLNVLVIDKEKINRYSEIYKGLRCEASSIGMQINIHSDIWSIDTRRSSKCLRCESGVQLQREILLSDSRELFYFYSIFRLFECAFCQMCSSKKHVTRVCVLSQSAYEKHNQEKSP